MADAVLGPVVGLGVAAFVVWLTHPWTWWRDALGVLGIAVLAVVAWVVWVPMLAVGTAGSAWDWWRCRRSH